MASLKISFNGRDWTLTDESSQSTYGAPVLVSDTGATLWATEIAIPEMADEIWGTRPAVPAYFVVCHGERNDGEDISAEDWPAIRALLDRYHAQWEAGERRDRG